METKKPPAALPEVRLVALKTSAPAEVRELVEFVNRNYPSQLPLEDHSILSGRIQMFWATDAQSAKRIGTTGYMVKTPFLAEAVKTVVAPEFRGKGFGEAISMAVEDEVRKVGFSKLMTTILVDNLAMIIIRLKQGYRFEGFHPDHESPGLHEYSMGKKLE